MAIWVLFRGYLRLLLSRAHELMADERDSVEIYRMQGRVAVLKELLQNDLGVVLQEEKEEITKHGG